MVEHSIDNRKASGSSPFKRIFKKKQMQMQSNLWNIIYGLGGHIGKRTSDSVSISHKYVLGIIKNRYIINVKYTIYMLTKSLYFISNCGQLSSHLLFHISSLFLYRYDLRFTFVNLIHIKEKHAIFDDYWVPSQTHNIKKIKSILKYLFVKIKSKIEIKWFDLLTRIIFYTYIHRIFGISFSEYFLKVLKFWKFFSLFKFFKSFTLLPDVFIILNALEFVYPMVEIIRYRIPVVGTVDTNMRNIGITYPIIVNDKSLLLNLFFAKLFINSYNKGIIRKYKLSYDKKR